MKTNAPKKPLRRSLPARSPAAKRSTPDGRPIRITGKDAAGRIVAEDRTDSHWKAQQIAAGWRSSGFEVEVTDAAAVETAEPKATESAGPAGRPGASGEVLGQLAASL